MEADGQRANKRISELDWQSPKGIVVSVGRGEIYPVNPPPTTHTICSLGHENTMYFSAVFDTVGFRALPEWNDAFNDFLRKNYSAEGIANCTSMNTNREAQQLLNSRVAGIRVNNHKVVETGWRYNASVVITKPAPKPTPKVDDDPEPAPAKQAPPASALKLIQDAALKEVPNSVAYCQKDPIMSQIFNCEWFGREISNYRVQHAGEVGANDQPENLASLIAAEKFDSTPVLDSNKVSRWVTDRAAPQKLSQRVINCVTQTLIVTIYKKPTQFMRVKEFYNEAVRACNK
ncbi:MAG: hypothetical protein ACRD6X_16260 [Pyrinomonadaceae bacterium]